MTARWQVQERAAASASGGKAWWVMLPGSGYLWCVTEEANGTKTCSCPQVTGCDHINAVEAK